MVDPVTNQDVPLSQEGELWIRGPVVMMYGLVHHALTFQSKPSLTIFAGVMSMTAKQPAKASQMDGSGQEIS